jgi:hypothetical protein
MRWALEMHAAHGPGVAGPGVVDLGDLAVAKQGLKFLGAEEADECAAGVAVGQGLHDLEIGHRRIENVHAAAQPP